MALGIEGHPTWDAAGPFEALKELESSLENTAGDDAVRAEVGAMRRGFDLDKDPSSMRLRSALRRPIEVVWGFCATPSSCSSASSAIQNYPSLII
jgi:hypothetical protein